MHVDLVIMSANPQFYRDVIAMVLERARYLRDHGHAVSIMCRAEGEFYHYEDRDGIHIYPIRTNRLLKSAFVRLQSSSTLFLLALRHGLDAARRRQSIDLMGLQDGPAIQGVCPFVDAHRGPWRSCHLVIYICTFLDLNRIEPR